MSTESSSSSSSAPQTAPEATAADQTASQPAADQATSSDYYWNSYAHFGIHEEMLKDTVRTRSYRNSILHNKHLFKGKIVLDVGCGTGILSMFAATAGAKQVFAVDASNIIDKAAQIVKDNNLDHIVTTIKGKIEEITLPVDKVDIIISEWMGYFLFYESMLDTVIFARDKWLAEGGIILPDRASLSISAIEDEEYKEDKINWWENVWGYNMKCIRDMAMQEPLVDVVEAKAICTDTFEMLSIDIATVKTEHLAFCAPFKLTATRDDRVHAFVAHFDIWFTPCHKTVHFSTSPFSQYTHWKQTVFYLEEVLLVTEGDVIEGTLSCQQNKKNKRDLDIVIEYTHESKYGTVSRSQQFFLR